MVDWFGAIQAQQLQASQWAIACRSRGLTRQEITDAAAAGEIVRTWPMRGTLHWVPAADAGWMLRTTGTRALPALSARWRQIGLDLDHANRAVDLLAGALTGGDGFTRQQCVQLLEAGGLHSHPEHGYQLLLYSALVGVTVIGPEQRFVLADEWIPHPRRLERDEALACLALRYLRSHGPASRADLARWSGLTLTDTDRATSLLGATLTRLDHHGTEMLLTEQSANATPAGSGANVRLLPAFDEYLIGYKDRSVALAPDREVYIFHRGNGVAKPVVLHRGQVIGTWHPQEDGIDARPIPPGAEMPAVVAGQLNRLGNAYRRYLAS